MIYEVKTGSASSYSRTNVEGTSFQVNAQGFLLIMEEASKKPRIVAMFRDWLSIRELALR